MPRATRANTKRAKSQEERARTSQVSECDRSSTKFLSTVHLQSKRVHNDPWPYTRNCNVALGTLRHCGFNQFAGLFLIIIRTDYSYIELFSGLHKLIALYNILRYFNVKWEKESVFKKVMCITLWQLTMLLIYTRQITYMCRMKSSNNIQERK